MLNRMLALALMVFSAIYPASNTNAQIFPKATAPFLGWNSYNCYGTHINEKLTWENLEAFIQKLKPHGYEYFVLDAGWYKQYDLKQGEIWPTDGDKAQLTLDAFGRYIPSHSYFPNGFKAIVEYAHKHGVKFGLHLMRGIPREAVEKNMPILGTKYFARDIANVKDVCSWSDLNYGIDMSKSGAQQYYNSVVELVSSWGVDFIKYDDIVHKPLEINAVADAIEKTGRRIVLSISPGDDIDPKNFATYRRADMIRISRDVWDLREDIQISFDRWDSLVVNADKGFWLDMDMIPFGHIRVDYPVTKNKLSSGRGYERMDYFSFAQKKSFITQRAMAASPLFMGGTLTTSPNTVFELITDHDMLACNQNGVTGKLVTRIANYSEKVDVWKTLKNNNNKEGWIGVFNRNPYLELINFEKLKLGLQPNVKYELYDIWGKKIIDDAESVIFEIPADDVLFMRFKAFN
jgi:alpha-galactosidase